jgi:hypothetical protein
MSQPAGEVLSAVSKIKDEMQAEATIAHKDEVAAPEAGPDSAIDDPLGAFLEEVDESTEAAPSQAAAPAFEGDSDEDDDEEFDLDEDDGFDFTDDDEDPLGLDSEDEDEVEAPPVVEKPRAKAQPALEAPVASAVSIPAPVATNGVHDSKKKKRERVMETINEEVHSEVESQPDYAPERLAKSAPGKLVGWFVSFSDPDGVAVELREGRFFVTSASIKGSDLIVDDPSISTPHALVKVSVDNGLWVQDLMSDKGTHVCAVGSEEFKKEEGARQLKHGDIVRFGDVEFVASVLAKRK